MSTRPSTRAGRLALALGLAIALGPLSPGVVWPKTGPGIGVAPFEQVTPPGTEMPDVASLLVERLGTHGVEQVIGPSALEDYPLAEPGADRAREWGERAGVVAIVTGRATQLGQRISLDLRVRSAGSGALLGTFVEEAERADELPAAVDRLAARIASAALGAPPVSAAPPEAARSERAPAGRPEEAPADSPPGLPLPGDTPIAIRSDELEVLQDGGLRRLLFTRNVRVSQDDVSLEADRLEAFYPAGSSQPERLVATGHVRVDQRSPARSMRCDEATYFRQDQRVLCGGNAELRQDDDRVQGSHIEIFLDSGRLRVSGGAVVNFRPAEPQASEAEAP